MTSLLRALCDAWEKKRALRGETDALRLLNAEASGVPGLVAEWYADHLVVYDYDGRWIDVLQREASEISRAFGWQSVSLKDRVSSGDVDRGGSRLLAGAAPARLAVREGPLDFWVEPNHARNVGLFLDTRMLRARLRAQSQGTRVLNLFSYTCSLGLSALAGGAEEVINVDVSARYLAWGKENLRRNALLENACRFTRMPAERYLDWAAKNGRMFDQVIFDPPVFARCDGGVFRFADDYFRLLAKCASRLDPGGKLYAITNYAGMSPSVFAAQLRQTLQGRPVRWVEPIPLPPDFEVAVDAETRPAGNALLAEIMLE